MRSPAGIWCCLIVGLLCATLLITNDRGATHVGLVETVSAQANDDEGSTTMRSAMPPTTASMTVDRAMKELDASIEDAETTEEALSIYRAFINDRTLPSPTRDAAQKKLDLWQQAIDAGLVRCLGKWMTQQEVRNIHAKSDDQTNMALSLVRVGEDRVAFDWLLEASRINPTGIQADFITATVFAVAVKNYGNAQRHYEACLRRSPKNSAVLNNLAIAEVHTQQYREAALHLCLAAETSAVAIHNIGRLIELANAKELYLPSEVLADLRRIRTDHYRAAGVSEAKPLYSWKYMLLRGATEGGFLEDVSCWRCGGTKTVRCTVAECDDGRLTQSKSVYIWDQAAGTIVRQRALIEGYCSMCDVGKIICPSCGGTGVDANAKRPMPSK
jgi:tetratricopeptide (TPR) repeat protein